VVQGQTAAFSVVAKGTAPFSYQWNFNGTDLAGATDASLTIPNAQATNAGNYYVTISNVAGGVTSATRTMIVNIPAGIVTQPQSQAVIKGQNPSLIVVATGTTPLNYQWYLNGLALSNAVDASLTLTNVQPNDAGDYFVVVNNNWGTLPSAVATVTVVTPAGIQTQPASQTVLQGQTASFSVVAKGTPPFSYQWNFNGTDLAGATDASLTIPNAQAANGGNYYVVITNLGGSVSSQTKTLTVNLPPAITNQPQSLTVAPGQTASFSVGAIGTATLTYQWYFNGSSLGSGARSSALTLDNVATTNAGNYFVTVINSYGSVLSAVAVLTVTDPPPPAPPSLAAAAMASNGFTFQFSVPVGHTYVISASTDLQDWTPISTNLAQTASVAFTDPAGTNYSRRFYRAIVW
jgi:hypothetical protein